MLQQLLTDSNGLLSGGFYGSKDPKSENLKKKKLMLEEEGVFFDSSSEKVIKVAEDSLHSFDEEL